jgi:hypothetical protein
MKVLLLEYSFDFVLIEFLIKFRSKIISVQNLEECDYFPAYYEI